MTKYFIDNCLDESIIEYRNNLVATKCNATVQSYIADVYNYLDWYSGQGLDARQVDFIRLINYYNHLLERDLAASTMTKKFRGLRRYYKFLGLGLLIDGPAIDNAFEKILQQIASEHKAKSPKVRNSLNVDSLLARAPGDKHTHIRNRVILLLRYRYNLTPAVIVELQTDDIDVINGVITWSKRELRIIPISKDDNFAFRQWTAIRKSYQVSDTAYLISLHWTQGRSAPYAKMSTRAINHVVNRFLDKYGDGNSPHRP